MTGICDISEIAWVTAGVLYMSSRLVVLMRCLAFLDLSEEYRTVTVRNIALFYPPFFEFGALAMMLMYGSTCSEVLSKQTIINFQTTVYLR